jgi:hypothetical protein
MKKVLKESQLKQIVAESVKRVLMENYYDKHPEGYTHVGSMGDAHFDSLQDEWDEYYELNGFCLDPDELTDEYREKGWDLSGLSMDDWYRIHDRLTDYLQKKGYGPFSGEWPSKEKFDVILDKIIKKYVTEEDNRGRGV